MNGICQRFKDMSWGLLGFSKTELSQEPAAVPLRDKVSDLMQDLIIKKQAAMEAALQERTGKRTLPESILIGGDVFTTGYLGFQGVQALKPAITHLSGVAFSALICGEIAGLINIGVALVSLMEACQAFKNGDTKLGLRLTLDFICFFSIGVIMILVSLAMKVAALTAIGTFFAANPWLLPVLFFIATIPVLTEVASRIKQIWCKQDLGSQLDESQLKQQIEQLRKETDVAAALSDRMEILQANIGVIAAIETFKFMKLIVDKKEQTAEGIAQKQRMKNAVAEWNHAQYVRLGQQILYLLSFFAGLSAFLPKVNQRKVNATNNFFLAGANAIPFYMDSFWPFKRNTPIVVPKIT